MQRPLPPKRSEEVRLPPPKVGEIRLPPPKTVFDIIQEATWGICAIVAIISFIILAIYLFKPLWD